MKKEEIKACDMCANFNGKTKKCETMMKPFDDYSCFNTIDQKISVIKSIVYYCENRCDKFNYYKYKKYLQSLLAQRFEANHGIE